MLTAASPDEAVNVFENHEWPIDLLLADVVLPEMSGRELAERIRPLQPDLRVMYMSGYSEEVVRRHGVLEPGVPFVEKPFEAEALLVGVHQALEADGAPD